MANVTLETINFVNKGSTDFDTNKQPINAENLNAMQTNTNTALQSIQDNITEKNYIYFTEYTEIEDSTS